MVSSTSFPQQNQQHQQHRSPTTNRRCSSTRTTRYTIRNFLIGVVFLSCIFIFNDTTKLHSFHLVNNNYDDDNVVVVVTEEDYKNESHFSSSSSSKVNKMNFVHKVVNDKHNGDDDDGTGDDNQQDENDNSNINIKKHNDKRLNVLILYPDDWRHDSIGSEKPYVLTPFLNQLAKEGIRFTQNAVTTSVCWMSRATLWTGQYSSTHKSYKLKCPWFMLPQNWKHSWVKKLQTYSNHHNETLVKGGSDYYVGHVGKWQYWKDAKSAGFDWSYQFEGHHWEEVQGEKIHASDYAKIKAIKFLNERPKDQPFVLSVAFYPPKPVGSSKEPGQQWFPTNETKKLYEHVTIPRPEYNISFQNLPLFLQDTRLAATARFHERYRTEEHFQASMRNYYALVTGVDKACKEIVDKLKEDGLYNNTMIIFTTDNGMFHGAHGLAGKWYPYQESIRVPLIIYDPRMPQEKVGTLDESFTLNIDLAETILGATGMKPDELMQGRDISDLYLPNEKNEYHKTASVDVDPWREEFFYEFPSPDPGIPASTALVRKEWKYIDWLNNDHREQLFNLKDDPLELNDLYHDLDSQSMLETIRKRHNELKSELFDSSYSNFGKCDSFLKEFDKIFKV